MTNAGAMLAAARIAPLVDLVTLVGAGPVIVLAPHPDDESLGCGGLIAACAVAGIAVQVALLTDGQGSHPGSLTHPPAVLAQLRHAEMQDALAALGPPPPALHLLGWPDRQAPRGGEDFARAAVAFTALTRRVGARTILAPWQHDPHCDHEAAAAIAMTAALATRARLLCYPVWGVLLAEDTPVHAGPALRLDISAQLAAKRRAIECHRSQLGGLINDSPDGFIIPQALLESCLNGFEIFFDHPAGMSSSVATDFFDKLYMRNPDPWSFASSDYERAKYDATLAALGRPHFDHGLEIGCSIGVLTERLAAFCDRLLAVDVANEALEAARRRCASWPGVRFAQLRVPEAWPRGEFDLILFSEVLYFLEAPAIVACAELALECLAPGGVIVLVHWLGDTGSSLGGDAAADLFLATCRGRAVSQNTRTGDYRLDRLVRVWQSGSVTQERVRPGTATPA